MRQKTWKKNLLFSRLRLSVFSYFYDVVIFELNKSAPDICLSIKRFTFFGLLIFCCCPTFLKYIFWISSTFLGLEMMMAVNSESSISIARIALIFYKNKWLRVKRYFIISVFSKPYLICITDFHELLVWVWHDWYVGHCIIGRDNDASLSVSKDELKFDLVSEWQENFCDCQNNILISACGVSPGGWNMLPDTTLHSQISSKIWISLWHFQCFVYPGNS